MVNTTIIKNSLYTTKEIEGKKELNTFLDEMIHIFQHNVDKKGTAEDLKNELKRPAVGLWKFGIIDGVEKGRKLNSDNNNGERDDLTVDEGLNTINEQPKQKEGGGKRSKSKNCSCH